MITKFQQGYQEDHELADGLRFRVRMIRPEDKQRLREGFDRLSPESRYRRFLSAKDELTEAELRYFTEVDGINHVALAAVELDDTGAEGPGIGVARFVRLAHQPQTAELAVAVVDEHQNKGIGRLLLRSLLSAAEQCGVKTIRGHVLADNEPMLTLLEHYAVEMQPSDDGMLVTCELPIAIGEPELKRSIIRTLFDVFRQVAAGTARVPSFDHTELGAMLKRPPNS